MARQASAAAITGKYQPGQPVTIYYDPNQPQRAVRERGARVSTWFLLLLGGGLVGVGLLVAVIAPIGIRAERAREARGKAHLESATSNRGQ